MNALKVGTIDAGNAAIMTYIHQDPKWPQFTWDSDVLASALSAVRHKQGKHLGRMESIGFPLRSEASLEILTADVVKSWAIEGYELNPGEVRSSIARRLGLDHAGLPTASRAVDGVVEMMLDATQNAKTPLTTERLFGWHAALFQTGHSGIHPITVGAWRPAEAGRMQVVSGIIGREKVHFEAPEASRLDSEMQSFLAWFHSTGDLDPVLKAGIAHLWFVTIHPFEDGNGRIARAIGDMALALADGTHERFYSLSSQIEAERKRYYDELESAQRGGLDITAWLQWFLACLDRALDGAEESLAAVLFKARVWGKVNQRPTGERQRKVLNRLLNGFVGKLTTSKYAKLAKCSTDTALRDIGDLVERGVLIKSQGGGRSTSYSLREPGSVSG